MKIFEYNGSYKFCFEMLKKVGSVALPPYEK